MQKKSTVRFGIAPIAWTNDDMPDLGRENTFEQCVSEMALAGYEGCEVGCKYPKDATLLREALDIRGLQVCNCWFSSYLISRPYEETELEFVKQLRFLKALGAGVIGLSEQSYSSQGQNLPIFENRHVMTEGEWGDLCRGLNRLGRVARENGMKLTFHHHMGTVVQTGEEVARLLAETDPESLYLLYDSGHLAYCGEDYVSLLKTHVGRVAHVHLKDIRPDVVRQVKDERMSFLAGVRAGAFTVPGDGAIDFRPIFKTLSEAGYQGWMVVEAEQDPARANPFRYAKMAMRYLKSIESFL